MTFLLSSCLPEITPDDPSSLETSPDAPSALNVVLVSNTEIDVFWTDNSDDETNFVVAYGTLADFSDASELSFDADVVSASVFGLIEGTEYYFRVKALNSVGSSVWSNTTQIMTTGTITSDVIDTRRQQVLAYITNLSFGNATEYIGTVSGQNCYHGNQITNEDWSQGYKTMVEDLYYETGEWVGMIGIDYEYDQIFTPAELSAANQYLIEYANAGGLITINLSPQNPWVNDEMDILNNPGSPSGDSSPQSDYSRNAVTSLYDLIDEDKVVYEAWMRKLDRIADALEELKDAGVIVLWRPMQEMNGNWMWWGMDSHPNDPQPYIEVYRHMYDYFTNDRGLNNLIWVYSPNSSFGNPDVINNTSSWNRSVTWAYPGDEYVDVVSGTEYDSNLVIHDYEEYASLGKPMGMAEIGPSSTDNDFQMDNTVVIEQISNYYPRISYWVSWHWNWALINQNQATELLTDSRVINRGNFDTTLESGDTIDNPNPVTNSLIVHFLNNSIVDWDEPYLYYWYNSEGELITNDWPGLALTKEGDSNWYIGTIEGVSGSNVIFTQSSSAGQTVDLYRTTEGWFVPTGIDSETGKIVGIWYDSKPEMN